MLKGNRIILPSDVIKDILKNWIRVLIIALLLSAAFAGYFYYSDKKKTAVQARMDVEAKSYDINDFTEEELNQANNAIDAYDTLAKMQVYYDNSYIQKVDPFAVHQTVLYCRIDIDSSKIPDEQKGQEANLAAALRPEYTYYVSRGDLGTDVAELLGIDPQYITELISVENDGNIAFNVILKATDLIPGFSDKTLEALNNYRTELEQSKNAHKITIINQYDSVIRIDDYYNRQRNATNELTNFKNTLNNLLKDMSMEQVAYYNAETGSDFRYINQETGKEDEPYEPIGTKGLIKKSIVGVALGIVLSCIVELFIYMYSRKVVSETDFSASLGMTVLGNDKNDEEKKIVIAKIKNACKRLNINRIILAGSSENILKKEFSKEIKNSLEKEGIETILVSDFIGDSKKTDLILNISNLVLLEGVGKSKLSKVLAEAELIEDFDLNLLGVVNCISKQKNNGE